MWFEILKTGQFRDSKGKEHEFTDADLERMVEKYDPSNHEAPVVIGHPRDNDPAFGWVEGLKRVGHTLFAEADNRKKLVPEFVDMLKKGLFKKRSVSVYADGTLRHVGFLGAMPPAVKGLADIQFSDEEPVTIEFEDEGGNPDSKKNPKGGNPMKFMEWIKGLAAKEGVSLEDMPRQFSEAAEIEAKAKEMAESIVKDKMAEFSEGHGGKVTELEKALRRRDFASFCDGLVGKGTLTLVQKTQALDFMEILNGVEEFEFSEGDDKKVKKAPLEAFKTFLNSLSKQVEFGEHATRESAAEFSEADEAARKIASASPKEGGK